MKEMKLFYLLFFQFFILINSFLNLNSLTSFLPSFITSTITSLTSSSSSSTLISLEDFPLQIEVYENGDSINFQIVEFQYSDCNNSLTFLSTLTNKWNIKKRTGKYFNEVAIQINSCNSLKNGSKLFFVDEGRLFIWPSFELGHRAIASSVKEPPNKNPIVLETLSLSPRVFRIYNFFTEEDSKILIKNALELTEEDYRLKRSSTGTNGYSIDDKRTSENAFDTTSDIAMKLKRRCFELLGITPYEETWADGLQILRYNQTTAYINHLDYIESDHPDHDWDSAGTGTNRFATIVLYLSDVIDGGETFFPHASEWFERNHDEYLQKDTCSEKYPEGKDGGQSSCMYPSLTPTNGKIIKPSEMTNNEVEQSTTEYLTSKNISHLFPEKSWQRRMVGHCRTKMSVKPLRAEAVLFYSQHPDGRVDLASLHGGCPVLEGTKWAANLWVWNGPRMPYLLQERRRKNGGKSNDKSSSSTDGAPTPQNELSVLAIFENNEVEDENLHLYWQGTDDMGSLNIGESIHLNSFVGHQFVVKSNSKIVSEFVVRQKSIGGSTQRFYLKKK